MNQTIQQVIEELNELQNDPTVPKNVRNTVVEIIKILSEEKETSVAVHKALNALESVSDDTNIEPYTRTQLWDVASLLEKV